MSGNSSVPSVISLNPRTRAPLTIGASARRSRSKFAESVRLTPPARGLTHWSAAAADALNAEGGVGGGGGAPRHAPRATNHTVAVVFAAEREHVHSHC